MPTTSPAITPLPSTPLPSTDLPSITLPPPVQPSIRQPVTDASAPKNSAQSSLHVEVMPVSDWTPPADAAASTSADTKAASDTDRVTPASAAIPESTASELPPDKTTQAADDLPDLPPLQVEAAHFKDIQPGVTTADELVQQWGEGKLLKQKDGTQQRVYKQDLYPRMTVSIEKKKVSTIDAQLDQPTETDVLAERLHLDLDSSVPVLDDNGQTLGQSYPDRGLLFSYDPGTKLVSQILLESIDPQPFLVRATTEAELHPGWCLRDVDYALQLDPKHAETHDIRAQMLMSIGRPGEALKSEQRSVELAPDNAAFLLSKAAILARLDQREDAIKLTQTIVDRTDLPRLLKAHALCQLADLMAAGSPDNGKRAIELYMSAIKTAQPLVSDQRVNVRRLAKRLLLDAHLGAATEIAWGVWQKKAVTVERWIRQADQLAKDLVDHEEADPQLRLEVARRAVSAAAGIDGNWNASEWTQQALDTGRKLIEETDDPLRREQLEWELGTALVDALELQRTAGLNPQSLAHAMAVLKYLAIGNSIPPAHAGDDVHPGPSLFSNRRDPCRRQSRSCDGGAVVRSGEAVLGSPTARISRAANRPQRRTARQHGNFLLANGPQGRRLAADAKRNRSDGEGRFAEAAERRRLGGSLRQSRLDAQAIGPFRTSPIVLRNGGAARYGASVRATRETTSVIPQAHVVRFTLNSGESSYGFARRAVAGFARIQYSSTRTCKKQRKG